MPFSPSTRMRLVNPKASMFVAILEIFCSGVCVRGLISAVMRIALSGLNWTTGRRPTRLYRRTRHRSVGAEHAAIARLGAQELAAASAFIEILARVGRH